MVPGMILPRFDYEAPTTVEQAAALLAQAGAEAAVLAGGTDLLVKMKRGAAHPRLVVSLRRIEGLDRVEPTDGGGLRIGPLVPMERLARSPLLSGPWVGVAEGAGSVGGPLIRNRATIGGNIVNGRPCADGVPPLTVLGATLRLEGPDGTRVVDLDGFITGPGRTSIRAGEVLTAIDLPAPPPGSGSAYLKITRRAAMEVTIVGCGASVELDPDRRTVRKARLVFTSVAPVPLRVKEAEREVEGRAPDDSVLRAAGAAARRATKPIDDQRAPAEFRSEMVDVLARRALRLALDRAGWRAQR